MVWDIWWNGSNMWWNGLWIHSISSEWPSVVHKLYSYWCFHGSCNILAFCLPSFNSSDRSADKSICIIILMSTSYLKKYPKKTYHEVKGFFVFLQNLSCFCWWPMTKDFIRKSQMYSLAQLSLMVLQKKTNFQCPYVSISN